MIYESIFLRPVYKNAKLKSIAGWVEMHLEHERCVTVYNIMITFLKKEKYAKKCCMV